LLRSVSGAAPAHETIALEASPERVLADAQDLGRSFPIAAKALDGIEDVPSLDLGQRKNGRRPGSCGPSYRWCAAIASNLRWKIADLDPRLPFGEDPSAG
jgi:hypothetical protein